MNIMTSLEVKGLAHLCFTACGSQFHGLVVTEARNQYTLRGQCKKSHSHVDTHECCFDETSSLMELTVIDHGDFDEVFVIPDVMKSGGDNCSLISDSVEFHTDQLLVDLKAEKYIEKFFSKTLTGQNCMICVGDIDIKYRKENINQGLKR